MTTKIFQINEYIHLSESKIHNKGVFASKTIPPSTKIIQYKGELISSEEGTKRQKKLEELSKTDPSKGAVYIFEIDEKTDLDGSMDENYAKNINHSCDPNCKYEIKNKEVWIISTKQIKQGEEICFNYGFEWDPKEYADFPCKCGSKNCVGYILEEKSWDKLAKHLKK